jgi:hypothetical protein
MRITVAAVALALVAVPAWAKGKKQRVHDHGHAKLGVAVDGNDIAFDLEIPGDDVFGFEHAPKNDAEKKAVDDAMATLNGKAPDLFVMPPDLGCKVASAKADHHQEGEHGDVDANYKLACAKSPAGASVKLGLFAKFPRLREVKVQVNSGAKQGAQSVTSADQAIAL